MKAWAFHDDGLRWSDLETPEPGPGQVRVRVIASALNHVDLWIERGVLRPPMPHVPGLDLAGVVDAVGEGVTNVCVGDEVMVNPTLSCGVCSECLDGEQSLCESLGGIGDTRWGGHAQHAIVPAVNVAARPANRSWEECAALPTTTMTAWRMLRRAGFTPTDTVLVAGIGGGVATAAMALATWCGARVVVTSRSEEKRKQALDLGAHDAIDSAAERWGVRADLVIETIGAATWERSVRSLAPNGRIAVCGGTSGPKVDLNLGRLWAKQHSIIGSSMGSHRDWNDVRAMFARGLPVIIDRVMTLDQYPAALRRLDDGAQFGKIVLRH